MAEKTWRTVEAYFDTELNAVDPELGAAIEASVEAGLPSIQVSASQGKLLYLLAPGPRRPADLGSWHARGLQRLVACTGAARGRATRDARAQPAPC